MVDSVVLLTLEVDFGANECANDNDQRKSADEPRSRRTVERKSAADGDCTSAAQGAEPRGNG